MKASLLSWSDKLIHYGVYALFLLVPLVFTNSTSELFELNKMWLTWEVTLIIAVAWIAKMLALGQLRIQRTPLDIPLLLFLFSQIIATLFSLDQHTSFWGYYSRFNGGLLSTITYIFLYYCIATNFTRKEVIRTLMVSLIAGVIVSLWGFPSHFGKDPTCLLFRGTLDVSCWTEAFHPTVRIFSTLGQPAWLAAYLNVLLPLLLAYGFSLLKNKKGTTHNSPRQTELSIYAVFSWKFLLSLVVLFLFFSCLLFTSTRAGIIAFWVANTCFWVLLGLKRQFRLRQFMLLALGINLLFLMLHFIFGTSFAQLDRYTLPALTSKQAASVSAPAMAAPSAGALGGTDSGKIRQIVWQGAIDAWKANPIFGSGVETFAFAYYRFRPADHNLTSEWDYLYNKAHNEYLNYLTTTGIVGLGTYLLFIGTFLFITFRYLVRSSTTDSEWLPILAIVCGFITILITNFFGFSVVIMNLYLFLLPIFVFLLHPSFLPEKSLAFPKQVQTGKNQEVSVMAWTGITTISLVAFFLLMILIRFWYADKAYALGSNLSNVQEYQSSYLKLGEAVNLRPSEPTFKDEFATNNAMIATLLLLPDQNATPSAEAMTQSQALAEQAINLSNEIVTAHPNNITFWKSRVRIFYTLAQVDKRYLPYALDAVEQVRKLAPTDAKVMYNLGALYLENNDPKKASAVLEKTILLKPDYRDAYYSLAVAYNNQAVDANGNVSNQALRDKAVRQLRFILDTLSPEDKQAKELLTSWGQ